MPTTAFDPTDLAHLVSIVQHSRELYAQRVADRNADLPWWTAVVITASSARQAARYTEEIHWRRDQGKVPADVTYLVVPDIDDERIGSGSATLNALRRLAEETLCINGAESLEAWWRTQRVLMIHSGGDSRRLPQYSLTGKLFSALPVKTPWGETSTVFDEMLALTTAWAARLDSGLVVTSGDVIVTFDAAELHWNRPGVSGVALRSSLETAGKHGVFVMDPAGRVYAFLQKPSAAQIRAAGGLLPEDTAALDSGILYFDTPTAARLMALVGIRQHTGRWESGPGILEHTAAGRPFFDLYEHFTRALTGEWAPDSASPSAWRELAEALRGVSFWCDLVHGDFTHVGTTQLFRQLMVETTSFSSLYEAQQRLGRVTPPDLHSQGIVVDSVLTGGGTLGARAIALECDLSAQVTAESGAILHGLVDLPGPVRVPEDTVVHQIPVALPDGRRGTIIRVYGVGDDPKATLDGEGATWFGRPLPVMLAFLGLSVEQVWPDVPPGSRSLWNAKLFPLADSAEAWTCACWLMGLDEGYTSLRWAAQPRLSLAESAQWADSQGLAESRARRMQRQWQATAYSLAVSGADIRPLLAHAPGIAALQATARLLEARGARQANLTEGASAFFQAHLLYANAGLAAEAQSAYAAAFNSIRRAVDQGVYADVFANAAHRWQRQEAIISAPVRVDLGGGWSDTPPFCLDWGGTVLNMAVTLEGVNPIHTSMRRLDEPIIRCISDDTGESIEYATADAILAPLGPGNPFAIPCAALQMTGLLCAKTALPVTLEGLGGGLEIRTQVRLPMGSGLGTSSILAATVLQALAAMLGLSLDHHALSDQVLRLEQLLSTGGGWQDQAGAIFPGVKLITTGPGACQRLRIQPLACPTERLDEFTQRCVLYYTGIQRIAKDLLAQVVGRYLARETRAVQVLHSIKTLASEMAYALCEGEWRYLGQLIDRHWQLNQELDEHTTNAPIAALLAEVRPYIVGAKLTGAGGGGFMILVTETADSARNLRRYLSTRPGPGRLYEWSIADQGVSATD